MWQVAVACSVLVALLFYYLGAGAYLWRIAVGFGAVPSLIVLLLRGKYMWESPMWAARDLAFAEAAKILEKTYGVRTTVIAAPMQRRPKISYKQIFAQRYLSRTVISSVVCITMSSEYFAVGFYLPSIAQEIFGKEFIFAAVGTLVSTVIGAIGGLVSAYLVDRVGLRRLIASGYLIIIVSLVAFWWTAGHSSPYLSILLIYLFIIGQTVGPGPQATTISALAYPTIFAASAPVGPRAWSVSARSSASTSFHPPRGARHQPHDAVSHRRPPYWPCRHSGDVVGTGRTGRRHGSARRYRSEPGGRAVFGNVVSIAAA